MGNKKHKFFELINLCSCFSIIPIFNLTSCTTSTQIDVKFIHNEEYGGCSALITPEEFNKKGFCFGDGLKLSFREPGVDIVFENVPYYNGFYVQNGEPIFTLLTDYLYFTIRNCPYDLWEHLNLGEETTVTISLTKKREYIDVQNLLNLSYSSKKRDDYDSDEAYVNFHSISGGELRDNYLYRGSHPCNIGIMGDRYLYANRLLESNSITYFINLANTEQELSNFLDNEDSSINYYRQLWSNKTYITKHFSVINASDESNIEVAIFFKQLIKSNIDSNNRIYVHCNEGKDRTGFVCLIIEALCDCDYKTIKNDYLLSFINLYDLDEQKDVERINAITKYYFNQLIALITFEDRAKDSYEDVNFKEIALNYLKIGGMSEEDITKLINLFHK